MCNCTNVMHKCTRQYPHSPVNNECSWCDMTSINYVFFWCVPLCEWIPISWNHGSDTVFALWTIVCQWVGLYMWLFAPGQRSSNDQNNLMFVQLVITFMNSVFCTYILKACLGSTLSLKPYCISPMLVSLLSLCCFQHLSSHVVFQADVIKDPCGTEEWNLSMVHLTF